MLPQQSTFTFSDPVQKENKIVTHSVEMEYDAWAERIKGQHNHFGRPSDAKFGAWTRRAPQSKNPDEGEFEMVGRAEKDGGSGTPSPELWKKAEPPVIKSADSSPVRSHHHNSHSARAQTIAKYRQEMLDLVRGMPETAYELSLRDIVESPKIITPLQETAEDKSAETKDEEDTTKKKKKKKKKKGRISRSESMDAGGPFLKMFIPKIPTVLGGRKSTGSSGTGAKVSPNLLGDGEKSGPEKSTDREWWSEEFGQMTSSSGSSNSSDSNGRRNRKLRGCYPFFQTR